MRKKILIISQHFWPETFRVSDIARGFVENDIEVDVLCGIPNYPNGIVPQGYGMFRNKKQDYFGATVYRCWEIVRKGNSSLRIFLNYISYPFFAGFKVLGFLGRHYDAVFVYETSPVYMIWPGIVYSKLTHTPLITYVLDLWPDNLYSVLNIQNKFLRAVAQKTSTWCYKKCDRLIAMSPSLKEKLMVLTGKSTDDIAVIPQYCETFYEKDVPNADLQKQYENYFKIVYAGNISPAQNLEVAVDRAKMLKSDGINDIKFIIVGDGMSKDDISNYAKDSGVDDMFDFLGSKPAGDIPIYHTLADCLLATLKKSDNIGMTIPAKITSYLAAARPIVACIDGEGAAVIKKAEAGLTADSGDAKTLHENILHIYNMSADERRQMGERGREYHMTHHQRDIILKQLIDFLLY